MNKHERCPICKIKPSATGIKIFFGFCVACRDKQLAETREVLDILKGECNSASNKRS